MQRARDIDSLSTRAVNSVNQFVTMIESLRREAVAPQEHFSVQSIMEKLIKRSGLEVMLTKLDPDKENEVANVNELISSAAEYDAEHPEGSLQDYLAQVSLVSDADHLKDKGGAVTLMTLHAAKGLEFPVVAMIGLEEGVLPHSRASNSLNELEEERRLCFVGITRAQQRLFLAKAAYRTIRGMRERTVTSPFLGEMPQDSLDIVDRAGMGSIDDDEALRDEQRERMYEQSARFAQKFKKGQLVKHPTFGLGRIVELSAPGSQTRATVHFNSGGTKRLILEYANLQPVG
jgi:DNA helicase-2/ATP-dependent DNA helicase PcrA